MSPHSHFHCCSPSETWPFSDMTQIPSGKLHMLFLPLNAALLANIFMDWISVSLRSLLICHFKEVFPDNFWIAISLLAHPCFGPGIPILCTLFIVYLPTQNVTFSFLFPFVFTMYPYLGKSWNIVSTDKLTRVNEKILEDRSFISPFYMWEK